MPQSPRFLIVQMGRPPDAVAALYGEQGDWFAAALAPVAAHIAVAHPAAGDALPEPLAFDGVIVTGSWAMVTEGRDWSERTAGWLRAIVAAGVPVLGVCYGHQLMAYALGGRVGDLPGGAETGRLGVCLRPQARSDPLLAGARPRFYAYLTHRQCVLEAPPGARVLAFSNRDRFQVLRYAPSALSFQFHPEFGPALMRTCIERSRAARAPEQRNRLLANLGAARQPRRLLHRFVATSAGAPVAAAP